MKIYKIRRRPKHASVKSVGKTVLYPIGQFRIGEHVAIVPMEEYCTLTRQYRNNKTRIIKLEIELYKLIDMVTGLCHRSKKRTS